MSFSRGRRRQRGHARRSGCPITAASATAAFLWRYRGTGPRSAFIPRTFPRGPAQGRVPSQTVGKSPSSPRHLESSSAPDRSIVSTEADFCLLPDLDLIEYARVPDDPLERITDLLKGTIVFVLPVAGPCVAFGLWQFILRFVHKMLGEERNLLELTQMTLNPTTNGIVVASLATALGTLTSITVWTLRQRQLDIRSCLNKEACELALLKTHISSRMATADKGSADAALYAQVCTLLRQYVARLLSENSKRADVRRLEGQVSNNELLGIVRATTALPPDLQQLVLEIVHRLNDSRSVRLATVSTTFPVIHWVILALLASSIAVCFLIEVDQSEGRFLSERPEDSLRLRIVFTILVGTFSGLTGLCADLSDPYRGSFNITGTADQLVAVLDGIDMELERALVLLNPSLSRGDVERAMKVADKDGNGTIDFDEFTEWLQENCTPAPRSSM